MQANRPKIKNQKPKIYTCQTPQDTFDLGERFGANLRGGELILLSGGLGAGKTLFTKGVLYALNYDVDEVTSPSFTLVNLYRAEKADVYHIDLWRIEENADAGRAVGLDEIAENERAIVIIEWAERLKNFSFHGRAYNVKIEGDGDAPRTVEIERTEISFR